MPRCHRHGEIPASLEHCPQCHGPYPHDLMVAQASKPGIRNPGYSDGNWQAPFIQAAFRVIVIAAVLFVIWIHLSGRLI